MSGEARKEKIYVILENLEEYIPKMKTDGKGRCWNCDKWGAEFYRLDTLAFYDCPYCKAKGCIDFSGLMPMFGVPLAREWEAEEKAALS